MKKKPTHKWCEDIISDEDMEMCKKPMCMEAEDECMYMQLAHAYVPWQHYTQAFNPCEALMKGTLFPELVGLYLPPR